MNGRPRKQIWKTSCLMCLAFLGTLDSNSFLQHKNLLSVS
jgi:hypothetical protein